MKPRVLSAALILSAGPAQAAATYFKANMTTFATSGDIVTTAVGSTAATPTNTDTISWTGSIITLANATKMTLGGTINCATLNFNPSSGSPAATAQQILADGNSLNLYTSIVNAGVTMNGKFMPVRINSIPQSNSMTSCCRNVS